MRSLQCAMSETRPKVFCISVLSLQNCNASHLHHLPQLESLRELKMFIVPELKSVWKGTACCLRNAWSEEKISQQTQLTHDGGGCGEGPVSLWALLLLSPLNTSLSLGREVLGSCNGPQHWTSVIGQEGPELEHS